MDEELAKSFGHIAVLAILLGALLLVLVFTGILGCNVVPGGCDIYYSIFKGGSPKILIAHSDYGMGDYEKLYSVLNDRDILGAQVSAMDIDHLTYGNINEYDLIIVTEAKKICSSKLILFQSYYNSGGRLVWTGDAGTQLCLGDSDGTQYSQFDSLLLESEKEENGEAKAIGPWARKNYDKQLLFDEFLGINYKGNHCEFTACSEGELTGHIEHTSSDHKLVYGLSPSIEFSGDFAVVELNDDADARLVAVLDYGSELLGESSGEEWLEAGKKYNFGRKLPFIVTNMAGERLAYYAAPLETLMEQEKPYKALIEQMYYGMLYK